MVGALGGNVVGTLSGAVVVAMSVAAAGAASALAGGTASGAESGVMAPWGAASGKIGEMAAWRAMASLAPGDVQAAEPAKAGANGSARGDESAPVPPAVPIPAPAREAAGEPPPQAAELWCGLSSLSARAMVYWNHAERAAEPSARLERSIDLTVRLRPLGASALFCGGRVVVTRLTDEHGREVARAKDDASSRGRREWQQREQEFQIAYQQREFRETTDAKGTVRGIESLPRRIGEVSGYVELLSSGRIVREAIGPGVREEPVELAKGLTLLMTKWEPGERRTVIGYEVRVRRHREGDAKRPGEEPSFIGMAMRDGVGRVQAMIGGHVQWVEARDEYILVVKEATVPMEAGTRLEAIVAADVTATRCDFSAKNIGLMGGEP